MKIYYYFCFFIFFSSYLSGEISNMNNTNNQSANDFVEQINIKTSKGIESIDNILSKHDQEKQDFAASIGSNPGDLGNGLGDPFSKILDK